MSQSRKQPLTLKKGRTYSDLEIDEVSDNNNQLRTEIYKMAHRKIKGENVNAEDEKSKFLEQEAIKIIDLANEVEEKDATYEQVYASMINMEQYKDVKMAVVDVKISGSSEEELDPNYQTEEEILSIISGKPEIIEFYVIGKIELSENAPVEPRIEKINSWKIDQEPVISIEERIGKYVVYKLTIESSIRKYRIIANEGTELLASEVVSFSNNIQERLLLKQGFNFNFKEKSSLRLSLFEQLIILSMFNKCYQDIVQIKLEEFKEEKNYKNLILPQSIFDSVKEYVKRNSLDLFYETILNITAKWGFTNICQEQSNVYKLVLEAFLFESYEAFGEFDKKEEETNLHKLILNLVLRSEKLNLIPKEDNKKILLKLLNFILEKKNTAQLRFFLERVISEKFKDLQETIPLENFIENYINKLITDETEKLGMQLLVITYYIESSDKDIQTREKMTPVSTCKIINLINPTSEIKDEQGSLISGANSFAPLINKLNVSELNFQELERLLKIFPIFAKLRNTYKINISKLEENLKKEITDRNIWRKLKESKETNLSNYEVMLSILRQFYLNPVINQSYGDDPNEGLSAAMTNFTRTFKNFSHENLIKIFSKMNEKVIIPWISSGLDCKDFLNNQYHEELIKLDRKYILSIVNSGTTNDFLQKSENEQIYGDFIVAILNKKFTFTDIKGTWHNGFKYCDYINERLLEKALSLGKAKLENIRVQGFISEIKKEINEISNEEVRDKLLAFVNQSDKDIDEHNIKELMREGGALRIIKNIKKGKEEMKKNKLVRAIESFQRDVYSQRLNYQYLCKIIPKSEKDRLLFEELFSKEILMKMENDEKNVSKKLKHIANIKELIDTLKNKFHKLKNEQSIQLITEQINNEKVTLENNPINNISEEPFLPKFPEKTMRIAAFSFFWDGFNFNISDLETIIEELGVKVNSITTRFESLMNNLKSGKLVFEDYKFFGFDTISQHETNKILELFLSKSKEESKRKLLKAIKNNKLMKVYKEICSALKVLIEGDKESEKEIIESLDEVSKFLSKIESGATVVDLAEFENRIGEMKKILDFLKLPLTDEEENSIIETLPFENIYQNVEEKVIWHFGSPCNILTLIILVSRREALQDLKKIKGNIPSMKQMIYDNQESTIYLEYSDFNNYTFVIDNVYAKVSPFLTNKGSISKLITEIKLLNKAYENSEENLNRKLISTTNRCEQFMNLREMIKNPNHMQSVNIKKLVEKSRVIVEICSENNKFSIKIEVFISEKEWKEVSIMELEKYKDEACIMKNKAEEYEDKQEREEVINQANLFLDLSGYVEDLGKVLEILLISNGYIIFPEKNQNKIIKTLEISNYNLSQLKKYLEEMSELSKQWGDEIEEIKGFEIKINTMKNNLMRKLYLALTSNIPEKHYERFRVIATSSEIKQFKSIIVEKGLVKNENKANAKAALDIIKQFCSWKKTINEINIIPNVEREIKKVVVVQCSELNFDYVYALTEVSNDKLGKIKETQMLNCQNDTTKDDIISFIERSLIDIDSEYYMLGYERLSDELQEEIIKKIEENTISRPNKMKLFIVGDKPSHRIFRYFTTKQEADQKTLKAQVEGNDKFVETFLRPRFQKSDNSGGIQIFSSAFPGLGKTYEILQQIKKNNRDKPIFFPISGRTTTEKLHERLSYFLKEKENEENFDLIVQLYEIEKESIDIVNSFLRQVCLFRSYTFKAEIACMKLKTNIYIEIQDESYLNLPFLKQICQEKQLETSITHIKEFDISKIQPKLENIKLCYILDHLAAYELTVSETIKESELFEKKDLPNFNIYKPKKIPSNFQDLLKRYFLEPFKKMAQPNFYEFGYWVDLLFESCCSFSGNMMISADFFKDNYKEAGIKTYGLESIRKDFFKVLLNNSIEFLAFSVENLQNNNFDKVEKTNEKDMNKIPFFLVPNVNNEWFSYVYRNYEQIPKTIRFYLASQEMQYPKNAGKTLEQMEREIGSEYELETLDQKGKNELNEKLKTILRNISGNNLYNTEKDPGYVLNLDNFIKICLISYKMKVKIPLLIQGEAGVGKTALLRHLTEQIFNYEFLPFTINAGITSEDLKKKIEEAEEAERNIAEDEKTKKKVCIFFDEFNTLPELGYIKEIMMEGRFIGEERVEFKNLIVFAACNPFRRIGDGENSQQKIAFQVKKPPLAMGSIMWNFGSLTESEMNKYVSKMLCSLGEDLQKYEFVKLIEKIQNKLNKFELGSSSLRDIERFRQIYSWLKDNLPISNKIPLKEAIEKEYVNKPLRAAIIALDLTYISRLDSRAKVSEIKDIINQHQTIKYETIMEFKRFEQEDFCSRLRIPYEGVSLNISLQENLYSVFICAMKCIPILIVGSPGCSKSLSAKILIDNFRAGEENTKNKDLWLSHLPKITEFFFQGSESCLTKSLVNRFESIKSVYEKNKKPLKKLSDKIIPLFIFDEMGLAENSPDNPLKAIHEPLELSSNTKNKKEASEGRELAFLGISNVDLDKSKMSRFLVLRRPDIEESDLKKTASEIWKGMTKELNFNHPIIESCLNSFSSTYLEFKKSWIQKEGLQSETLKNLFGLRDFYNLVKTFAALLGNPKNREEPNFIEVNCDLAIYRNFSGFQQSYEQFKNLFFKKLDKDEPKIEHNALYEIIDALSKKSQRFPLVITEDNISESVFCQHIFEKFGKSASLVTGSPYKEDLYHGEYIVNCLGDITRLVSSDRKMIATSLNKTVEGSLFDLFNKSFIKRDGLEMYRYALDSGALKTETVHPQFNAAVIIRSENLRKESSAFLNRFEKYIFNVSMLKNLKVDRIHIEITKIIKNILSICESENLGHYKTDHLFFNYSEGTLRSLIYSVSLNMKDTNENELIFKCIHQLSRIASKDFELILNLVLLAKEPENLYFKAFEQGLAEKAKLMENTGLAIIITSDKHLWKTNESDNKTIFLSEKRNEKSLQDEIKDHLSRPKNEKESGILFFDLSRETKVEGSNLNDPEEFFSEEDPYQKVEIKYIIKLLKKCTKDLTEKQGKQVFIKKIRLILNYNRNERKRFESIPFSTEYEIFSLDGSSNVSQKEKILENVNMSDIIKKCFTYFKFVEENGEEQGGTNFPHKEFIEEISRNDGAFAECCKMAIVSFEGNNIQMNDEDKILQLQCAENLTKYNSITSALTKGYFEKKFSSPISLLIMLLANDKCLFNFADNIKNEYLSKLISRPRGNLKHHEKLQEEMKKFLVEYARIKIEKSKLEYRKKKQSNEIPNENKIANIQVNSILFFPFSSIETNLLFSADNIEIAIKNKEKVQNFKTFYREKLNESFQSPKLSESYIKLTRTNDEYWKIMLMADIVFILCEKAKIAPSQLFYLMTQINILLNPKETDLDIKLFHIIGNLDVWIYFVKVFNYFAQNGLLKSLDSKLSREFSKQNLSDRILEEAFKRLQLSENTLKIINETTVFDRLKVFIEIHHSVYAEIEALVDESLIEKKDERFIQLKINEEFLTLFESITENKGIDPTSMFSKISQDKNNFQKLNTIHEYLITISNSESENISKLIIEYLANKLFPTWFNYCSELDDVGKVFNSFSHLCEKSVLFSHNSTGSIEIFLEAIQINYQNGCFIENIRHGRQSYETDLRKKLFMLTVEECENQKFKNNLSILVSNIIYINLQRNKTLIRDPKIGFTFSDLQSNLETFKKCISELSSGYSASNKILSFAFVKLYLLNFIEIAKPDNQTCIDIDKILCEKSELMVNLRFYCLKLLRTKMTAKEIKENFIKIKPFKWCEFMTNEMIEEESKALEVPKLPNSFKNDQLEKEILSYLSLNGKVVATLDKIIEIGSKSIEGRYTVLNFFTKYIYTMAYSKEFQKSIVDHVKSKEAIYTEQLGAEEYKIILRYSESKFDTLYEVQKHESFEETDFILFNSLNWLISSRSKESPLHSLFFTNSKLNPSISKEISESFLPCGPENPFISIAKIIYNDTRNNNIGIYICGNDCDFIYSHLNCGWPSEGKDCLMCGKKIGSGGGHKIARMEEGARRIMSPVFVDNSNFYIGNFLKMEEFWVAQRCYLQAEINRMRTKPIAFMKPEIQKVRKDEKHDLRGFNLAVSSSRISPITSKILIMTVESLLYCFVSLDLIKAEEYKALFDLTDKNAILNKLNTSIRNYIKEIREVLNLNTKFYTWMFGIQAEIFKKLLNFKNEYASYIKKIEKDSNEAVAKLQEKIPGLGKQPYKDLYNDLARVIGSGLSTKEFKSYENQMNAKNQFTRQVFEENTEEIVTKYYLEGKLAFIEDQFELQGKMQFPFEPMLNESKIDENAYIYSRMLKVPSESLTFDQITTKYEIIIKDRYPVLDYLMKNNITFKLLLSFQEVVKNCNLFGETVIDRVPRFYCKNFKMREFLKHYNLENQIELNSLFSSWMKVSKDLGAVQVGCKIFGKMNDQLNQDSEVYNFLLDTTLKENAPGQIIAGIFHNFAKTQNELMGVLKNRKNMIPKYKKMSLFVQEYKKNPQKIKEEDFVVVREEDIMNKILEVSVPSIIYGENLVYHNFDFCENYFLMTLKGKCELEEDIEKYSSISFAGEMFSKGNPKGNMTANETVQAQFYEEFSEKEKLEIEKDLINLGELELYQVLGEIQKLIFFISENPHKANNPSMTFETFIKEKCSKLNLNILPQEFDRILLNQIIPFFYLIEKQCRPKLKIAIPDKYKKPLEKDDISLIKEYISNLPTEEAEYSPTKKELLTAVEHFVYRNLLSEGVAEEQKMFEYINNMESYWPIDYDIYSKNMTTPDVLNNLSVSYAYDLLELMGNMIK